MKRRTVNTIIYDNDKDYDGQVYYGWAMHVPESVGDFEVGTVSGDQNIAGVNDIYIKDGR